MDVLAQRGDLSSSELATEMGYTKVAAGLARAVKELMQKEKSSIWSRIRNAPGIKSCVLLKEEKRTRDE